MNYSSSPAISFDPPPHYSMYGTVILSRPHPPFWLHLPPSSGKDHHSTGEGVFLRPYSDPDGENPPQSCWLNHAPGPTPFVPVHFHHLESTLTAHSSNSPLPMFSSAIPLGPSACVYLNPGLLPPPRLAPPGDLAIKSDATPDPHCGGWGAIQYYYHFRPDSGATPSLPYNQPPTPFPHISQRTSSHSSTGLP